MTNEQQLQTLVERNAALVAEVQALRLEARVLRALRDLIEDGAA